MDFTVRLVGEEWHVVFKDQPPYLRAINDKVAKLDTEWLTGISMLVAFPVWSQPVKASVQSAIECARRHGGAVRLAVRAFEDAADLGDWWPGAASSSAVHLSAREADGHKVVTLSGDPGAYPMWLVLKDGQVAQTATGPRTTGQLDALVRRLL
jgi:hypothetical protein